MILNFKGFIKDVHYTAFLAKYLPKYEYKDFDINKVKTSGKIIFPNGEFAFSKWALLMPCDENLLIQFLNKNKGNYSRREEETLHKLHQESASNQKLEIKISSNNP